MIRSASPPDDGGQASRVSTSLLPPTPPRRDPHSTMPAMLSSRSPPRNAADQMQKRPRKLTSYHQPSQVFSANRFGVLPTLRIALPHARCTLMISLPWASDWKARYRDRDDDGASIDHLSTIRSNIDMFPN